MKQLEIAPSSLLSKIKQLSLRQLFVVLLGVAFSVVEAGGFLADQSITGRYVGANFASLVIDAYKYLFFIVPWVWVFMYRRDVDSWAWVQFAACLIYYAISASRLLLDGFPTTTIFATELRHIPLTGALICVFSSALAFNAVLWPFMVGAYCGLVAKLVLVFALYFTGNFGVYISGKMSIYADKSYLYMVALTAASFFYYTGYAKSNKAILFSCLNAIFCASFVALTFRRSPMVLVSILLLSGFVTMLICKELSLRRSSIYALFLGLIAVAAVGVAVQKFGISDLVDRVLSTADRGDSGTKFTDSNSLYVDDFDAFRQMIMQDPITGIGYKKEYTVMRTTDSYFGILEEQIVLHVGMLELIVRMGVAAVILLLVVFGLPIFRFAFSFRRSTSGWTATIVALAYSLAFSLAFIIGGGGPVYDIRNIYLFGAGIGLTHFLSRGGVIMLK